MKPTEFKKLIKEAVREAIQDELKDILLEAVKSSRSVPVIGGREFVAETVMHSNPIVGTGMSPVTSTPSSLSPEQRRAMYEGMLGETAMSFNSQAAPTFRPNPGGDTINGPLAGGDVSMDQIMNLMSNK
jgi:hypothetical protein